MAASKELTATVHTIIRRTISQYYVNRGVEQGIHRKQAQAGSVTFIQRFGSAINANLHLHMLFLEGVYVDRLEEGHKPRFVKVEPPSDVDISKVVEKISQPVIRKLRQLGYLEAGIEAPIATGYDPLADDEAELARSMAASVQQRIAFGEWAGQQVRRIGSGFGHESERRLLTAKRCARMTGFSLPAGTHQRTGVISWNACYVTRREAHWLCSVCTKRQMGISSTPSRVPGRTARPRSNCRH